MQSPLAIMYRHQACLLDAHELGQIARHQGREITVMPFFEDACAEIVEAWRMGWRGENLPDRMPAQ